MRAETQRPHRSLDLGEHQIGSSGESLHLHLGGKQNKHIITPKAALGRAPGAALLLSAWGRGRHWDGSPGREDPTWVQVLETFLAPSALQQSLKNLRLCAFASGLLLLPFVLVAEQVALFFGVLADFL